MNEISNKESKNKNGRPESFMKRLFNKMPKNIFGLFFVFVLIIFGLGFGTQASAASHTAGTYYICQSGAGTGDGSSVDNCRSVANHNSDTWTAPTIIYLVDTITSQVTVPSSGISDSSRIVYRGDYAGHTGSVTVTSGFAFLISSKNYISVINLSINSGTDQVALYIAVATAPVVQGCTVIGKGGIIMATVINPVVIGNNTTATSIGDTWAGIYMQASGTATVSNNVSAGTGTKALGEYYSATGNLSVIHSNNTASATTMYGLQVSYSASYTISFVTTDSTVTSTTTNASYHTVFIYYSGTPTGQTFEAYGMNLSGGAGYGIISSSAISWASWKFTKSATRNFSIHGQGNAGMYLSNLPSGSEISYGSIYGTGALAGIDVLSSTGINIHDLDVYDNKGDGIAFNSATTNSTVYNNKIHNNGDLTVGSSGDGITSHDTSTGNVFHNNIIYDNFNSCHAHVGTANPTIYNDTCYHNGKLGFGTRGGIWTDGTGAHTVKNVILEGNYPREINMTAASYTASSFSNNLYYHVGNDVTETNFAIIDGVNGIPYSSYVETNKIYANPLFVSPISNFKLLPTSLAINAGTNVSLTSDYLGNPIVGTPDIGAYEFQAPNSPTSLSQYKADGTTAITSGTFTSENSVVLKFNMSSSEYNSSDLLTPQVEIQELDIPFTNTVTNGGTAVAYSGSDVEGVVTITGLTSGKTYHWQARTSNPATTSAWVSMGGNPDFQVDTTAPLTPIASPSAGTYYSAQNITLTADGSDSIRYSTTETPADCSAGTLYTAPISVSTSQTIYVRACDSLNNSSTATFNYVIATRSSSGSSVSSRYSNLVAMGNIEAANEIIQEFPNQISNNQIPLVTATPTTSTVITTSSTPIIINRILKLVTPRMWGDDIKALQTLLNTKGYDSGTPDGNFGPKTQAGVIAFQKANGLTPDGSVGTNTLNYLNGNQTTTTSLIIQPTVTRTLKLLVPRMIGDDILTLQTYLNTNGYDVGTPDGVFGSQTYSAVIAFQTANNLAPDGIVGGKTREMMK